MSHSIELHSQHVSTGSYLNPRFINNRDIETSANFPTSPLIAIFASVRNRASSKIKTVRSSVELEDRVILLNNFFDLIEQKGTDFV